MYILDKFVEYLSQQDIIIHVMWFYVNPYLKLKLKLIFSV